MFPFALLKTHINDIFFIEKTPEKLSSVFLLARAVKPHPFGSFAFLFR